MSETRDEQGREWWPEAYMDEGMPTGRPSPSNWILQKDGSFYVANESDDGESRNVAGALIVSGQIVAFVFRRDFEDVQVSIAADGSFEIVKGAADPRATHFGDLDDGADSIDQWVIGATSGGLHGPDGGSPFTVQQCQWSDSIPFRLVTDDGIAFVAVDPKMLEEAAAQPAAIVAAGVVTGEGACAFTVHAMLFAAALERAALVVERHNTIPILSHVLIEAMLGHVVLTATDLESELRIEVPAVVSVAGSTTAAVKPLLAYIQRWIGHGPISAGTLDRHTAFACGAQRVELTRFPAQDFPRMTLGDAARAFEIDARQLHSALDACLPCIGIEETRFYLTGVHHHLNVEAGTVTLAATDGHRLVVSSPAVRNAIQAAEPLPQNPLSDGVTSAPPGDVVPGGTMKALRQLLRGRTDTVRVVFDGHKVQFTAAGMMLTAKCIGCNYPDYPRIIPKPDGNTWLSMDAAALHMALANVLIVAGSPPRGDIHFAPGMGAIKIAVHWHGDSFVALVPATGSGAVEAFAVNIAYLRQLIEMGTADVVTLQFTGPAAPILVYLAARPELTVVLMPMRV